MPPAFIHTKIVKMNSIVANFTFQPQECFVQLNGLWYDDLQANFVVK